MSDKDSKRQKAEEEQINQVDGSTVEKAPSPHDSFFKTIMAMSS